MLFNKNFYRKANDKKVLHKVGKQWKVISVALLMAIGGGAAIATHANAHADAINTTPYAANQAQFEQKASNNPQPAKKASSGVGYYPQASGSAAYYFDHVASDNNVAAKYAPTVNSYVQSLNNEYNPQVHSYSTKSASASAAAKNDAQLASSYSATLQKPGTAKTITSLAAKNHTTPQLYEGMVENQEQVYSGEVNSASADVNANSDVDSLVSSITGMNFSSASLSASTSSAIAHSNFSSASSFDASVRAEFYGYTGDHADDFVDVANKLSAGATTLQAVANGGTYNTDYQSLTYDMNADQVASLNVSMNSDVNSAVASQTSDITSLVSSAMNNENSVTPELDTYANDGDTTDVSGFNHFYGNGTLYGATVSAAADTRVAPALASAAASLYGKYDPELANGNALAKRASAEVQSADDALRAASYASDFASANSVVVAEVSDDVVTSGGNRSAVASAYLSMGVTGTEEHLGLLARTNDGTVIKPGVINKSVAANSSDFTSALLNTFNNVTETHLESAEANRPDTDANKQLNDLDEAVISNPNIIPSSVIVSGDKTTTYNNIATRLNKIIGVLKTIKNGSNTFYDVANVGNLGHDFENDGGTARLKNYTDIDKVTPELQDVIQYVAGRNGLNSSDTNLVESILTPGNISNALANQSGTSTDYNNPNNDAASVSHTDTDANGNKIGTTNYEPEDYLLSHQISNRDLDNANNTIISELGNVKNDIEQDRDHGMATPSVPSATNYEKNLASDLVNAGVIPSTNNVADIQNALVQYANALEQYDANNDSYKYEDANVNGNLSHVDFNNDNDTDDFNAAVSNDSSALKPGYNFNNVMNGAIKASNGSNISNLLDNNDLVNDALAVSTNGVDKQVGNGTTVSQLKGAVQAIHDVLNTMAGRVNNLSSVENTTEQKGYTPVNHHLNYLYKTNFYAPANAALLSAGVDLNNLEAESAAVENVNAATKAAEAVDGIDNYDARFGNGLSNAASSANSALGNAQTQSATYSQDNDEDVTLSSYFAKSYVNASKSESAVASGESSAVNSFFVSMADDPTFTNADNAYAGAESAAASDKKMGEDYSAVVYNNSPHYLDVTKGGNMHSSYNFGSKDDKVLGKVNKGDRLTVIGVNFNRNGHMHGATRYLVYDNNTKQKGFFTGQPSYSTAAYLNAVYDTNNVNVSVKTLKPVTVYNDINGGKAVKTLKAGTVVDGVTIVSDNPTNDAMGFTKVETPDYNFFTANVDYVKLNNVVQKNTNNTPEPNNFNFGLGNVGLGDAYNNNGQVK